MHFEAIKTSALRDFRVHMRKYLPKGKYIAVNLNLEIRRWLAHELRQNRFELETMGTDLQIELIEFIETSIRKGWLIKSKNTRETKAKTKKREQDLGRQQKFKF